MLQTATGTDFRGRVADFYRGRGYQVRENCRVRGTSEKVYAVEMVAQGPHGNLLVSFGDAGGIDPMEIGRVRTLSKDIGATPVIAAPSMDADMRQLAAQMAVVVVDENALDGSATGIPTIAALRQREHEETFAEHPWPVSGRAQSDNLPVDEAPEPVAAAPARAAPATPETTPAWPSGTAVRDVAPATPSASFSWLEKAVAKVAPEAVKPAAPPAATHIDARLGPEMTVPSAAESLAVRPSMPESPFIVRDRAPTPPPANAIPRSHADEILDTLDAQSKTYSGGIAMRDVEAKPVPKADIEIETTLLPRKATPVEKVRGMGDAKLLYVVLGLLAAATALYVGLLLAR